MKFLRFSLFIIIFSLFSSGLLREAYSDPTVVYQFLEWNSNFLTDEVDQDDITGTPPTQIANINYQPGGNTIGMQNVHGFNGTDYGFYYQFFFAINYNTLSLLGSGPAQNTTIWNPASGTSVHALAYNTSFTHVSNNVFLMGIKASSAGISTQFDSVNSVGSHSALGITDGVAGCFEFTTLTGDIFHEFVIQVKNDTSTDNAYELFVDGNYWCTFSFNQINDMDRATLGHSQDQGTGSATGFLISRYREFLVTGGRHLYSQQLAGITVDDPLGNNNPAFLVGSAIDSNGFVRNQFSLGETFTLNGLLLNITTSPSVGIPDALLIFSRLGTTLAQRVTDSSGNANVSILTTGSVGDTRIYQIDYAGSESQNFTSAQVLITIEIIAVGQTPGNIQTSITISIHDRQGRLRDNIIHGETIFFQASMSASDRLNPEFKQVEFFIDKNNTGTLSRFTFATTTSLGVAQTQFFAFGTDWIGTQRVQARFLGDSTHLASNSTIFTFTVISTASQISIILELDPSTVISGNRFDALTRLNINPESAPPEPIIGETVRLWWSIGGNFKFLTAKSTDVNGIFSQGFTAPTELGTFTMKANATVNSVNVESTNQTLTVVALIDNIPAAQLPDQGGANLDDFLPDIADIDFGFSPAANGIMLWMIFFLMFAFGGIFAMFRTFPEAMSAQVIVAWFVMMFGASTAISFGLQWITLNFVILLLAPIALIGGIVMLRIFRGGGAT